MSDITLLHGDCLELLPTLADHSIDAIITDPPYGTTACKWDQVIPFVDMWRELKRIVKPRGAIVLFASQPFTSALIMSNAKYFRYQWVWEKTNAGDFMLAKRRPRMLHEDIAVFSYETHAYNPQMQKGDPYTDKPRNRSHNIVNSTMPNLGIVNEGTRYPSSIQRFSNANNNIIHPTQKPIPLLEYLIKTYTHEDQTVLDFTMGSGSTGVACINTHRHFIGIERDDHYFQVASERIHSTIAPLVTI